MLKESEASEADLDYLGIDISKDSLDGYLLSTNKDESFETKVSGKP